MSFKGTVAGVGFAGGLVAAGVYGIGEYIGDGNCLGAALRQENIWEECGPDFGLGEDPHSEATITGPEKLEETAYLKELNMTFGEVVLTLRFPRDPKTGKLTKADFDNGSPLDPVLDATRFVDDKSEVQVTYRPCTKLSPDYSTLDSGLDLSAANAIGNLGGYQAPEQDTSNNIQLEISREDPVNPSKVTGVTAYVGPLGVCSVAIPLRKVDDPSAPNGIVRWTETELQGGMPESVSATFDHATTEIALAAAEAHACPETVVDTDDARKQIGYYIAGVLAAQDPTGAFAGITPNVVFAEPKIDKNERIKKYEALVKKIEAVTKTYVFNPDRDRPQDIKFIFSEDMVKIEECGRPLAGIVEGN